MQDDPAWFAGLQARDDSALEASFRHGIETVPTLMRFKDGKEVESFTAELEPHGLRIDMWRVLAALSNNGEQRQVDLVAMTSIDAM